MLYSEFNEIVRKTGLSAEALAPHFGVSNMTIRRWLRSNPKDELMPAYEQLVVQGLEQMMSVGLLPEDQAWAQKLISRNRSHSISAALAGMGVQVSDLKNLKGDRKNMLGFLKSLGVSKRHQTDVDRGQSKIAAMKKMGRDWKAPLATLLSVVRSKNLAAAEKLIAYGALFYLLCPLDLIPDTVPLFGYADDFVFVSLAASFYVAKAKKKDA